jgi:hypothetical protein
MKRFFPSQTGIGPLAGLAFLAALALFVLGTRAALLRAADSPPAPAASKPAAASPAKSPTEAKTDKLVPLNKQGTILLDNVGKRVLLKSKVVLRQGTLELLCCLKQTKEHEAILSVDAKAYAVHTALLAIGAEPGQPAEFVPEFKPASGQPIDIFLQWTDEQGKPHRVRAQQWIRNVTNRFYAEKLAKLPAGFQIPKDSELRYDAKEQELIWYGPMNAQQKAAWQAKSADKEYVKAVESIFLRSQAREMQAGWVFTGSGFYLDEQTQQKYYRAEDGDLICVANFGSAMLDVNAESSAGNDDLLYEAYTERIPPRDTEVTIELIPVFKKQPAGK